MRVPSVPRPSRGGASVIVCDIACLRLVTDCRCSDGDDDDDDADGGGGR